MKKTTNNKSHNANNIVNSTKPVNNKTLPYKNIYMVPRIQPIHPNDFVGLMETRINDLNSDFHCGGKIRDGFIQFCLIYNDCVDLNSKGESIQLVSPAATGSAKTVSATVYLSEISKKGMSGLLVVSEVSVAIEAAETINKLAGKEVAGVYYSISDKYPQHKLWHPINDLPRITIITHAMCIKRSDSGKNIEALKTYNSKQRDIVIIDERIDLIKRVSFGTNEIIDAIAILKRDVGLHKVADMLANFNDVIFIQKNNGTYKYDGKFKQYHQALKKDLLPFLRKISAGHFNILPRIRGKLNNSDPDREKVEKLLNRVVYVIDGRYTHIVEGNNVICHREENLSGKFGSVVVLDATATINPEYDFRSINGHNIAIINKIASRNYSNVTLNICSFNGPKQSKWAIYNKPKKDNKHNEIVIAYLKVIGNILSPNDKLLVVTYMDVVPLFLKHNPYKKRVKFIHWGSQDARGSNDFKAFNKAMVIGWHRRPDHYYTAAVMAINQIDQYVNTTGTAWSDANHLKDLLIVDDMIQFFNRVRCRTAMDSNGNCQPVELYYFTGGNIKMEKVIRTSIESEMPNIVINDWKPKELKVLKQKTTKNEERAEILGMWLRGKIELYGEISFAELQQTFNYTHSTVSKAIKTDVFKNMIDEEGILMTNAKGRGNPVRFILPENKI
ncbi:MAG: hypothetical protein GY861_08185 [bacterium]|nr:hypothetical protein [bacterium]